MKNNIIKIIVGFIWTINSIVGQNANNVTNGQPWYESTALIIFTYSLLTMVVIYVIHLFQSKQKLLKDKDQLVELSIDLKKEIFEKDAALNEKSIELQIIKENTFDAIIILNNLGRILSWNSASEQIFGFSSEEVIGSDLIDVIIPRSKVAEFNKKYKLDSTNKMSTQGKVLHITAIRKNGTEFPAELSISDVRYDNIWSTVGIIRNVSDRETLEQELILSEYRLKLSLQGEEENLWDYNIKTEEMYFNPTVQSMLGFEKKEIRRKFKEWQKLIHPNDVVKVIYELEKHIAGKIKMVRIEYRMKSAYGDWNWIYTRGKIVEYDDMKKPLRFIATNTDINEQKQYELDVQDLQNQIIKEKEKSKVRRVLTA